MENNMMSLSINKEMLTPIIEQQARAMIAAVMGGEDQIVNTVIDKVLHTKVDKTGKQSSYSCDNNRTYFDWLFTEEITKAVKEIIAEEIKSNVSNIKKSIKKQIQSEKGATVIANALLNGLNDTLKDSWRSSFKIEIEQEKRNDY